MLKRIKTQLRVWRFYLSWVFFYPGNRRRGFSHRDLVALRRIGKLWEKAA